MDGDGDGDRGAVRLYADFKSEAALHGMVTAPIFIGSGSGFSSVAQMLRNGINVAQEATAVCVNRVAIKANGCIDSQEFTNLLRQCLCRHSHLSLQYNSIRQCQKKKERKTEQRGFHQQEMETWPSTSPSETVRVIEHRE